MAENRGSDDYDVRLDTDDEMEIDNFEFSPSSSPVRNSQHLAHQFVEMGFSHEMIDRAIAETGGPNSEPSLILETLVKYSTSCEASSSRSKVIDELIDMGFSEELVVKAVQEYGEDNMDAIKNALLSNATSGGASSSKSKVIDELIDMGFSEELVIKTIHEYGEDNIDDITNALLSNAEAKRLRVTEDEAINISPSLDNIDDDDNNYSSLLSSDEEDAQNSTNGDRKLKALLEMAYSRQESSLAIERCGENASVADLVDFIGAAQMARQFGEFFAISDEQQPSTSRKRRVYSESSRRDRNRNGGVASGDSTLIRLPNPMIGFGVPNQPGLMMERPDPIPVFARGPPYFYYENVACAPKGVWDTISNHLYGIKPEFVDSMYFCAAMRKRGYLHNLPIKNRVQLLPPLPLTIQEAFPLSKRWWPTWDERTKLNCLLTVIGSAQNTNRIRVKLQEHNGDPPKEVKNYVIEECKRWNFIWVGKNKVAPLDADEMEKLLGFPTNHTRGGGISATERYKSLGNSFQVDTVAYHLSVLKPLYPRGINVLSLFTGIGGAEVALQRLQIPMQVVVSVEKEEVNQNILSSFWKQTNQTGDLLEFADVEKLDNVTIERLMDEYGGFDLVIGGSPCNNLAGGNRVSRNGLEGDQSCLFYEYCRILDTVRRKAATMRR